MIAITQFVPQLTRQMLYLFNSAYRTNHLANVLNTLFLPRGVTNKYRYRSGRQVATDSLDQISANESVIVIFVDRFYSTGYRFVPLRFGTFQTFEAIDDYLLFQIQLANFVHADQFEEFQRELNDRLGPKRLPKADMSNRENEQDGLYVIRGESVFDFKARPITNEQSWIETVKKLSQTAAFKPSEVNNALFSRIEFSGKRYLKKTSLAGNSQGSIVLYHGEEIQMNLSYRFPSQELDRSLASAVQLRFDTDKITPPVSNLEISSLYDKLDHRLLIGREAADCNLEIRMADRASVLSLALPNRLIHFELRERLWDKIRSYVWFAINAAGISLQGFDLGVSNRAVCIKVAAALASAVAVYRLWKLGRKS